MKIIVGLGNPGTKYAQTRHNVGFDFVDQLIDSPEFSVVGEKCRLTKDKKFDAEFADILTKGERIIILKPQTYMNLSGESVAKVMAYYKVGPESLIVIADDIDLPVGLVRIRLRGSSGGHKGLQSIIDNIKTDDFIRFRIGVNTLDDRIRGEYDTASFVLDRPSEREMPLVEQSIKESVEYLLEYLGTKKPIPAHTLQIKIDT